MNEEEKLLKLRKLADAMYYAAQYLTTDASRLHKAMEEYHQFIINEYHKEEPVSEDLEKELARLLKDCEIDSEYIHQDFLHIVANHFADWQKQQMEAYRIEHCKNLTNEQAELEENFVSSHVEKNNRIPTFIDAIEYGIEYCKQQMVAKAIDATIEEPEPLLWRVLGELEGLFVAENNLHDGDGVKVIIVNKD